MMVAMNAGYSVAQKLLAKYAAILFLASMLTGGLAALGLSNQFPVDGKIALGAHLTALTGTLIMLGVAWTLPMTNLTELWQTRLTWAFILSNYANWIVSTGKAFFHVHGVGKTGETANDVVFILLNIFVVVPSIAAAIIWIRGLATTSPTTTARAP